MIKLPKLTTTLLSAILLLSSAFGQSDKIRIQAYVNNYKELAISEMLRTGVPASVTLAQGILETAGGQSDLASLANNHFGIKCKAEWTGETMRHDDDAKNECFRKYPSVEDSYKDHSDFLKTRPMYAFLFKLDPTDYEGWAKGLKKAGYATNPVYAQQLIRIIVENNLQSYTLLAMQHQEMGDELFATGSINQKQPDELDIDAEIKSSPVLGVKNAGKEKFKNLGYPLNSVFNINEAKVVYAEAGTSLLALANNHNVGLKKLIEFNELEQIDILATNQLIFLQKKPKKGTKDLHIVEENESMHDIAQKEGIQLSTIMEFNGLQKGMQPAIGEKIYLKYPAPSSPRLASTASLKSGSNM
ncbi:glucosaminidase domain-containing protein [Segetibacter aerophilus]|uniref:Peptidoglycan hydrolase n=1 Tax=Segetibacter aerophilus TaxID=670293 RepID=A0A512BBY9_9BACT|nr:glucosaminidase domain-containing protein [Segetibacter aerophilus]GEO09483.1 N-acetylmuramoyl-L-alanine amidase [Segetibacter aerophilus]